MGRGTLGVFPNPFRCVDWSGTLNQNALIFSMHWQYKGRISNITWNFYIGILHFTVLALWIRRAFERLRFGHAPQHSESRSSFPGDTIKFTIPSYFGNSSPWLALEYFVYWSDSIRARELRISNCPLTSLPPRSPVNRASVIILQLI